MTSDDTRTGSAEGEPGPASEASVSTGDASATAPAVLTVEELAELLRLDRKTVYNAIARKEIPGVLRFGRAIRLSRDAVVQWLRDGQGRAPRSGRSR